MKYIKETAAGTAGRPNIQTEITRAEALEHVTEQDLQDMEDFVRSHDPHFPGIIELLEVGPGTYVGVSAN